jgi:hypothetical protein
VLGIGAAYEIVDPARVRDLVRRGLPPWSRRSDIAVGIPLPLLSGRRIGPRSRGAPAAAARR